MWQLNDILSEGFTKYYNTLTQVGNVNKTELSKLIIVSWIKDALDGNYDTLVTGEQYEILSNLLACVIGSCLVPYTTYCSNVVINKYGPRYSRLSDNLMQVYPDTIKTL